MSLNDLTLRIGYAALITLALTLPFELQQPLLQVGPLSVSNTELLLALVLLAATLHKLSPAPHLLISPAPLPLRSSAPLLLLALYTAALFLSALFATPLQATALRAALRTLSGMLLIPAVLVLVPSRKALWGVIVALVAGGMVATAVGLSEVAASHDFEWLLPWRTTPTVAGPFLRLAGPFDYANQAAMFIEATLPLLVALGIEASRSGRRLAFVGLLAAFILYTQAAILTFSRAAIGAAVIAHLMVAFWLWFRQSAVNKRIAWWWGGAAGLVLILILINILFSPVFRLRLQSQVDRDWYRAMIQVPATLTMEADGTQIVPVSITNKGSLTWYNSGVNHFNLGMRWQLEDTGLELARHPRWPLNHNVAPGETITLQVPLRAPLQGGQYRLVWDMVHENVTWFAAKNPTEANSFITVTGNVTLNNPPADSQLPATATTPMQFDAPIPERMALWTTAVQLIARHPLIGIGLDNFRLTYGQFFNFDLLPPGASWNDTIHTNNWYLETMVSLGIVGSLPFFIWSALLLVDIFRALWALSIINLTGTPPLQTTTAALPAVAIGLLSFFIHGFLDYFMLFNATALLFWLLIGLWLLLRRQQ